MIEYKKREEENRNRERLRKEEIKRREYENNAKKKYTRQDPMVYKKSFEPEEDNPYLYYKSFNKKPKELEYEASSDEVEESSTDESDSSDGFPSPGTPKRRNEYRNDDSSDINRQMRELQRRIAELEREKRYR